jgi:hypothetical protein
MWGAVVDAPPKSFRKRSNQERVKVSTRRTDFEELFNEAAQGCSLELVAEYEPDEENEARILLMILGIPSVEVERIIEEMSLDSANEM